MEDINRNAAKDKAIILIISLLMFIPMSSRGNVIRFVAVIVLFFFSYPRFKIRVPQGYIRVFFPMLVSYIMSLALVLFFEHYIDQSLWMHELNRSIFNIIVILILCQTITEFNYIYKLCILILITHFMIQILQRLGYFGINEWIRKTYIVTENTAHLSLAYSTVNFRSGSIFMNPNIYMAIPCSVLCVVLQNNILNHKNIDLIWVGICFISMLLTGSRTTIVVAAFVIFYFIFIEKSSGRLKYVLVFSIAVGVIYMITTDNYLNYRVFSISSAVRTQGSMFVKISNYFKYIVQTNPVYLLFGGLGSHESDIQIDFEFGYLLSYYGLLGYYWYVNMMRKMGPHDYNLRFMKIAIRIIICLIALTATLFFCMPVFPFICVLTFSNIYHNCADDNLIT